ncbi:sensor histidine kinase [Pontibacter pamirensis]|uniref:sensor histidine kinase n=1 Tax=Pontibacter pamirensis TaxID=2562824 RepID=UPI001389EA02|nr:histidine kinase [Pontibacter pamirensis]
MALLKDKPIATNQTSGEVTTPARDAAPGKLRKLLKQLAFLLAAITAIVFIICPSCFLNDLKQTTYTITFSFVMFVGLWQANKQLALVLNKYLPWLENLGKRLVLSIVGMLVVSTVVTVFINAVFLALKGIQFQELGPQALRNNVYGPLFITFIISLTMHSRSFLLGWRQMAINAERLQKENIASQYESLKAQVNPHFLFNSLNVLTSLVETDQQQAVKFIRKLSEVYRYVLDSRQKEVVPLPEELYFLESYIYLQKIRHGNALLLYNDLPQDTSLLVVPLALQMLLENAIKHNVALEEEPLKISLYLDQKYIVVKNNRQERRIREESTGTGLANIEARYGYLTGKPVLIQQTAQDFIAKIPTLNFKA